MQVPPAKIVSLLEAPDSMISLVLHWSESTNQSIPCQGERECLIHDYPAKLHVYTVCLTYCPAAKAWVKCILDCGHPGGRLCNDNFVGEKIWIDREKGGLKKGQVDFVRACDHAQVPPPPLTEREDVRPYLMRRYGLFSEAEYFASLPYVEQGRLPFPGNEKAS